MTDLVDSLAKIECGCERLDAVSSVSRETLVDTLARYGFGRTAVPTDWATYYDTDELARFVLGYADAERPAA